MDDTVRGDALRGEIGWHMSVEDVRFGHEVLGFDYPMQGDERPRQVAAR